MKIDIRANRVVLNVPLRTFIEEKLEDIARRFGPSHEVHAQVEVGIPSGRHHSGAIHYAEVNLTVDGRLFRAEAIHHDLHSAIVEVKDDLKVQLQKIKGKFIRKNKKT